MSFFVGGVEIEPFWQAKPQDPYREALRLLCGGQEPPEFVKGYGTDPLTDDQHLALQDWASLNCGIDWLTGYGIIEAAAHLVATGVENGNIPAEDSKWRTQGRPMDEDPAAPKSKRKTPSKLRYKASKKATRSTSPKRSR